MTTIEFNHQLVNLSDPLNYFALKLTSDKDDAEDLLQETFLKALNNRDKYQDGTNFKAWLYTIMRNIFINSYRRTYKSKAKIDLTDQPYQFNQTNEIGKYSVAPDVEFNTNEINKIIDELNDEFKFPFKMHFEGFKYKEIACELDLNIGTVKSRIFHARKKLMTELSEHKN